MFRNDGRDVAINKPFHINHMFQLVTQTSFDKLILLKQLLHTVADLEAVTQRQKDAVLTSVRRLSNVICRTTTKTFDRNF